MIYLSKSFIIKILSGFLLLRLTIIIHSLAFSCLLISSLNFSIEVSKISLALAKLSSKTSKNLSK